MRPHLVISSHHAKDRSRVVGGGKKWIDRLWQSDVHRRSQSEYKIKWKCNTMAWRLPATPLLYMMCLLKLTVCRGRTEFKIRFAPNSFRYTLPLQIRWTIFSPQANKSSSSTMSPNDPSLLSRGILQVNYMNPFVLRYLFILQHPRKTVLKKQNKRKKNKTKLYLPKVASKPVYPVLVWSLCRKC